MQILASIPVVILQRCIKLILKHVTVLISMYNFDEEALRKIVKNIPAYLMPIAYRYP